MLAVSVTEKSKFFFSTAKRRTNSVSYIIKKPSQTQQNEDASLASDQNVHNLHETNDISPLNKIKLIKDELNKALLTWQMDLSIV